MQGHLAEPHSLELPLRAFNPFNHAQWLGAAADGSTANPSLDYPAVVVAAGVMQVAVRY